MSFGYFYGQQSDLFTFYRVPKVLFTNERFWNISTDAKMLYGILLDRMSLSAENGSGWVLHQTGFAGCESLGFAPANLLQQPNQYAKRANETGSIYHADIEDLQNGWRKSGRT